MPSLRSPAHSVLLRVVAAVVEQADDLDAGILLPLQLLDDVLAGLAAADDHGAAGEAAFARPFAHQQEQQLARDRSARPGR